MLSEQTCIWCEPNESGEFAVCEFTNPNDAEQKVAVSVYWGKLIVTIDEPESSTQKHLSFPISYCPFCGKSFNGTEAGE